VQLAAALGYAVRYRSDGAVQKAHQNQHVKKSGSKLRALQTLRAQCGVSPYGSNLAR
jgi:hypothetical protein